MEAVNLSRFFPQGKRFVGLGGQHTPAGGAAANVAIFGARDHHPVALGPATHRRAAEPAFADERLVVSGTFDMFFRTLVLAAETTRPPRKPIEHLRNPHAIHAAKFLISIRKSRPCRRVVIKVHRKSRRAGFPRPFAFPT
ncbi:hypothetical protein [Sphingomonas sp. UNC305MFCol5.2]|uniref:hypothetical protein n=1 Tax=Sphingomonas sp. UNC305MFCol5.2 TaxID=1449076 RepID=UPI0012DCFBFB|nr:hypothetical protein [Sphingomonas sp. UNC305MFCol5.2]